MEQVNVSRYAERFESAALIPKADRMVTVESLIPRNARGIRGNTAALFVAVNGRVFVAALLQRVPADTRLVHDKQGMICGIPAVAGG